MGNSKSKKKLLDKTICDWSKQDLREHFKELQEIVEQPKFVCMKCGRAAAGKKWLCKAKELE